MTNGEQDRFIDRATAAAKQAIMREAKRVAALLNRQDVKPQPDARPRPAAKKIMKPTLEQRRQAQYEVQDVVDREKGKALVIGKAYKRLPWFETMYARRIGGMDQTDLKCLRFYRQAHEASNRSEVKSCLNRDPAKGSGGPPSPALIAAGEELHMCEFAIGSVLDTMRAIVLEDQSFRRVAMARFGSRDRTVVQDGQPCNVIVPISKRHPVMIEEEFVLGLSRLRKVAELYVRLER